MRKDVACLIAVGVLGWGASTAQAAPTLLAHWQFDEGAGQIAADSSGFGTIGVLGATAGDDADDPAWIAGHDGGGALDFSGSQDVAFPNSTTLEPAHVAVDAWVRRAGSPGSWRYVLSKGSLRCDRSAYGLYSGFRGGLAFYVSDATHYVISPEVPSARVWDGAWHHVIGSYDGDVVRLSVDGAQVGGGTPAQLDIAYGVGSKGVYVGTYRGSCDLGFRGAIDDVRVWADAPPTSGGGVITPEPDTPTVIGVGGGGGSSTTQSKDPGSSSTAPAGCLRVSLSRHTVRVNRRSVVVATVRRATKRVAGVRVVVRGEGVDVGATTNRKGLATIALRTRKRGRLTVRVRGQRASCPAPTMRAL